MRELTVRLSFTTPCLGDVKKYVKDRSDSRRWPVYFMPRMPGGGKIRFQANWWASSLRFAASVMSKHQKEVVGVSFEVAVDGRPDTNIDHFYRRFFKGEEEGKFVKHEAFFPGDVIGVNCVVPGGINDDDFWTLMEYVGRFRGISPYGLSEGYGRFEVVTIRETPSRRDSRD